MLKLKTLQSYKKILKQKSLSILLTFINQNRHEFSYVNKISINLTPNACDIFKSKISVRKY